jgi:hypothetical protein
MIYTIKCFHQVTKAQIMYLLLFQEFKIISVRLSTALIVDNPFLKPYYSVTKIL